MDQESPEFKEMSGNAPVDELRRAGLDIIITEYVERGKVYLVESDKALITSPYNDLVWDIEWPKLLEKARKDIEAHIFVTALKMRIRLKNDFGINPV
jgi:hypothetical protein